MPAYNAESFIGEAIQSVLDQTYPNWELIVIDDGSTDSTADIILGFDDSRINLYQQPNGGESRARNEALTHIQGDIVAFLDADDMYLPNHLAATVNYLEQNPSFDAVYTDGYYCDSSGRRIRTVTSRRRGPYEGDVFAEVVRGSDLFGPPVSVVLRSKPIIEHDLQFDETITIGPDWVFLMQYAEVASFGYLDDYTCLYRLHNDNISLRINLKNRAKEHAKCRIRSVHMDRFDDCPVDVRVLVFYELLVNLLRDLPEEQDSITKLEQFQHLPEKERARLLRLLAAQSIMSETADRDLIYDWFQEIAELGPMDYQSKILMGMYKFSPTLTKLLIGLKRGHEVDSLTIPPFADIDFSSEIDDDPNSVM
jgi:glycosyltransferase involved in cell wall biosynthesis